MRFGKSCDRTGRLEVVELVESARGHASCVCMASRGTTLVITKRFPLPSGPVSLRGARLARSFGVRLRCKGKSQPEIKLGATVRLRAQSGEIISGQVVYMGEEKPVPMVRVASGDLVYSVPAKILIDERGSK
jgi:hypothetical protein